MKRQFKQRLDETSDKLPLFVVKGRGICVLVFVWLLGQGLAGFGMGYQLWFLSFSCAGYWSLHAVDKEDVDTKLIEDHCDNWIR